MTHLDFIPPIFTKVFAKLFRQKDSNFHKKKEYSSYELASKECQKNAYENIELCDMVAEKTANYRNQLCLQLTPLSSNVSFLLAAINNIRATNHTSSFTILDFGGACGVHYFEIKKFLPESLDIKWIVIETTQMVNSAKTHNLETEGLTFRDSLENLPPIDFIYSSGALQYTSKPYNILEQLLKIDANYILFNRMMFNDDVREIITIQTSLLSENGPGPMPKYYIDKKISYPHTTLSFHHFNSFVSKNYKLVWIFSESSGSHKIGNETIIGRGLYYSK